MSCLPRGLVLYRALRRCASFSPDDACLSLFLGRTRQCLSVVRRNRRYSGSIGCRLIAHPWPQDIGVINTRRHSNQRRDTGADGRAAALRGRHGDRATTY
eukprot:3507403-Prymnesium_polylepis.1